MNLHKSLELYRLLEPHLPEDLELEPFDFIGTIIENIKKSGKHRDYITAIELVSEKSKDDLLSLETMDLFELFTDGLVDVQIIDLTRFCNDIGLSDARS